MTAFNCAGVRRSKMPSGNNKTGRKIPKIPGSKRAGGDIALIGASRFTCDPVRTAVRMRPQRTHHEQVMPRNPHPQMPHRNAGKNRFEAAGTGANKGEETAGAVNGWLTSSITTNKVDCVVSEADRNRM